MNKIFCIILALFTTTCAWSQQRLGLAVYNGGGDWYANPTSLPNLAKFANEQIKTKLSIQYDEVKLGSDAMFNYPFIHLTGHGRIVLTPQELQNLKKYLESGGFLHVDDNYGMDQYVRPILNALFPNQQLQAVPFNHPIYQKPFKFANGLPKIHEHDNKPPQGLGLFVKDRLVLFYSYETDLGDGWEDPEVHNATPEMRTKALQMGTNLIYHAFVGQ